MIDTDEQELPDSVLSRIEKATSDPIHPNSPKPSEAVLSQATSILLKTREDAIAFRKESGIEEVWTNCEERYYGIDEANRSEYKDLRFVKPTVMNAPVTTDRAGTRTSNNMRSTIFVRLASRYVDAAAAKVGEILLDDKSFSFDASPVPDLIKGLNDHTPVVENGQTLMRPARPGELSPVGMPAQSLSEVSPNTMPPQQAGGPPPSPTEPAQGAQQPQQVPLRTSDLVQEQIDRARAAAKKAERRIWDWQVEGNINKELRKVIHDAARLGVGVLKGPFPDNSRVMSMQKGEDGKTMELQIQEKIVPKSEWRNPWNIFPDPACGDNIREGDFIWERAYLSQKRVRKLKKLPGYFVDQIDKVLSQLPGSVSDTGTRDPGGHDSKRKNQYTVWYFTGTIQRSAFEQLNSKAAGLLRKGQEEAFIIATLIDDVMVKCTINPLYSGDLNYHSVPWLPRSEFWAGVGPCEQVMAPQKIVNAATRAMLNNAGISAGGQIIIDQSAVVPADGDWTISPNKIWYATGGHTDDVRKAFTLFSIDSRVPELMSIIEYGMRLAEESTSIPLVTQGMSGPTTPNTLGQSQLQDTNANQLLRSVGYAFDDNMTDPHTRQYYEWLLLDPSVPAEEKGDFKIDAHGSTAKVERTIQDASLLQLLPLAQNPQTGTDLRKWATIVYKSRHIDPSSVMMTKDEQEARDKAMQQPPPNIQIAQIKAQIADKQIAADNAQAQAEGQLRLQIAQLDNQSMQAMEQLKNETARLRAKLDTDRDLTYTNAQREKAQAEYQHATGKLSLERELAIMEFSLKHQISLNTIKANLENSALKLRTQKELAAASLAVDVHRHHTVPGTRTPKPAVQLPGRAANGSAMSQVSP